MEKGCCTMNHHKKPFAHRPFRQLEKLIGKADLPVHNDSSKQIITDTEHPSNPENDQQLFQTAMKDVKPIVQDKCGPSSLDNVIAFNGCTPNSDRDTIQRLNRLVRTGEGFVIAYTPEYREGLGHNIHPLTARDLHGGRYSIQAHIDLHGYTALEAEQTFNDFMNETIRSGKRTVLIIHGRGLSSPRKPVLKSKVHGWLSSGPWRKWVLAFTSARACDGGAGATYVLLRTRSLTSRFRKKRS
jgi:DNA-nicking Smr family endonuclease